MLQQSMKNGQEIDDVSLHMMTKVTIARSAGAEREDIAQGAQEFLDTLLSEYGQATWSDPGNYQGNLVHLLTGHVLTVSMWGVALNTEPFEKRCKKTLDVLLSHGVHLNDAYRTAPCMSAVHWQMGQPPTEARCGVRGSKRRPRGAGQVMMRVLLDADADFLPLMVPGKVGEAAKKILDKHPAIRAWQMSQLAEKKPGGGSRRTL